MDDLSVMLPGLKKNISLAPHTSFQIGGPAKHFFLAKTKEDIIRAAKAARKLRIPFFILGGGTNILVADRGFDGLVVKVQNTRYQILNTLVRADAGVPISTLVRETGKRGFAGLEWAGGLPGTFGGAIRGNAGAFRGEIKNSIMEVQCLDRNGAIRNLSQRQSRFSYRSSIFKQENWIVLSAVLKLNKGDKKNIQSIACDHIRYRKERHPLEFPNAGSVFLNYNLKKIPPKLRELVLPAVKEDPFPLVPTAFLIAQAQLKGLRMGNAQISEKHPNYIVNLGNAKAREVLRLIGNVRKIIKKKFGIELEQEIQYVQ